jgi:beta-N-acetylglucosaminidase
MAVPFLSGAIEGFYGQPWTDAERVALFDWLAAWGLNTDFSCRNALLQECSPV